MDHTYVGLTYLLIPGSGADSGDGGEADAGDGGADVDSSVVEVALLVGGMMPSPLIGASAQPTRTATITTLGASPALGTIPVSFRCCTREFIPLRRHRVRAVLPFQDRQLVTDPGHRE